MADDARRMGDSQGCGAVSSREYWAEFAERHYEEVRCHIARQVRDPHDVDDLVQEVFVSLLMHARGVRNPHAYVRAVVKHALCAYWRNRKRSCLIVRIIPGSHDYHAFAAQDNLDSDPVQQLLHREMQQIVSSMTACLSPVLMEALTLQFIGGLRIGEAAVQAGCSHETFKKRLHRARQALVELHGGRP